MSINYATQVQSVNTIADLKQLLTLYRTDIVGEENAVFNINNIVQRYLEPDFVFNEDLVYRFFDHVTFVQSRYGETHIVPSLKNQGLNVEFISSLIYRKNNNLGFFVLNSDLIEVGMLYPQTGMVSTEANLGGQCDSETLPFIKVFYLIALFQNKFIEISLLTQNEKLKNEYYNHLRFLNQLLHEYATREIDQWHAIDHLLFNSNVIIEPELISNVIDALLTS